MDQATLTSTLLPGPILECLLDYLPIAALRSLQLTCRQFANLYSYALPTKWNVDRLLSRWLPHPKAFRAQLGKDGAVVSGSAALRFFDHTGGHTCWEPDDLDIYMPQPYSSYTLHWHLLKVQGYFYTKRQTSEEVNYPTENIQEVRTYARRGDQTGRIERIQVICIKCTDGPHFGRQDCCVQAILTNFHSTGVLNYLTATEAVSLYPYSTFAQRRVYLKTPYSVITKNALHKYEKRGLALHDLGASDQNKRGHPMRKVRYLGDKFCWRIRYGEKGISRPAGPSEPHGKDVVAPLWWTMNVARNTINCSLLPGHLDEENPHKETWPIRSHVYPITCHGKLFARQMKTIKAAARWSAADDVHVHAGRERGSVSLCTCLQRYQCEVGLIRDALQRKAVWTVDRMEWESRAWSLHSVGSCASVWEMEERAEAGEPGTSTASTSVSLYEV